MKGDADVIDAIETVASDLHAPVSDWPPATCSWIDSVLQEIVPIAKEAEFLERLGDEAEDVRVVQFASDVDTLLRHLPDQLEELRSLNDRLRTSLHEALNSRKEAADALEMITGRMECIDE